MDANLNPYELADTFANGNVSDVKAAIANAPNNFTAATLVLEIRWVLETRYGVGESKRFSGLVHGWGSQL